MSLTEREKAAVLKARYFGEHWGTKDEGLGPVGIVARMRGAEFVDHSWDPEKTYLAHYNHSFPIAQKATRDVLEWLGFSRSAFDKYKKCLKSEGAKIFETVHNDVDSVGWKSPYDHGRLSDMSPEDRPLFAMKYLG